MFVQTAYVFQDLLHFPAVSAGIHDAGAAYASRDPAGKFHAGQFRFGSCPRDERQRSSGLGTDGQAVQADGFHIFPETNDGASESVIRYQQIAAVSHNKERDFFIF